MPIGYDHITIERVQQSLNIVDVVSEYVKLVKKGREFVGLCPFHDDHRPSMNVSESKQIFKCFSCGMGGDVIKFVQMQENLTFPQAVARLAERAGITLEPLRPQVRLSAQDAPQVDPVQLARVNDWACRYFQAALQDADQGRQVRAYLKERGINAASIDQWKLGLAPAAGTALVQAARQRNINDSLLKAAGLIGLGRLDKFVNRLIFPILDVTGRVIAFGGRTLADDPAKYLNSPATVLFDKSNCLFGLYQARHRMVETSEAMVVEGYTDCIMAHQAGCTNVVATLGTSFTEGHARLLRRYARKRLILVYDGDMAGEAAANRAIDVCLRLQVDIKIASMPQGQDPCDFILDHGPQAFQQVMDQAVDVFTFKWDRLMQQFHADESLAGQKAAVEEYLQTIATSMVGGHLGIVERGLVVNRLAQLMGLPATQIDQELHKRCDRLRRTQPVRAAESVPETVSQADVSNLRRATEREILEVLLNEPERYHDVDTMISAQSFQTPILRDIADVLFDLIATRREVRCTDVLARIESIEAAKLISELAQVGQDKGHFKTRLQDAMGVWRECECAARVSGRTETSPEQRLRTSTEQARHRRTHNLGLVT